MLKLHGYPFIINRLFQPPSGGCVLKRAMVAPVVRAVRPAAFRRLCVETGFCRSGGRCRLPAAFRRLCVETTNNPT